MDLQAQSETEFLALTRKGLLTFNIMCENVEKVVRFKDPTTALIQFPFYDPQDLPYVIGDNLKLYDTKNKDSAGLLYS